MQGKVVLVTGASSGIGAETAVHFASRGCLLSLTGRNLTRLQETQRACVRAGLGEDDVLLISADLHEHENLSMIVEKTIDKFGKLDVLINNAGNWKLVNIGNTTVEDYDSMMNVNLKAVFFLTQFAVPHLIKTQGNVVNVSGCSSQRPYLMSIVGSAAKAGLDHFTRMLALELAPKNVRVNAVNPAAILTPILSPPINEEPFLTKFHALGRAGTVQEVARAIEFLADSEKSSFITGVCLLVDGGAVLKGPV